jgi:branched-chain amino acid transport system permease protein
VLAAFLQYLFSGVTVGATYAMVALGFTLIFNASHVINFAQGEFVMIGGMATVSLIAAGLPLPLAALLAIGASVLIGIALEKLAIEPARGGSVVALIIITIGASILLRGLAQLVWDRNFHVLPAFSGDAPIALGGATILPQSLWVIGGGLVAMAALGWLFNGTLFGKAMLATAANPLAARLVGISVRAVLLASFALSAGLGALAGILVAPITLTSYDVGTMLALKGFAAAVLGGLGSGVGAVLGGLAVGIAEAMAAGYLSSDYKDAIAFVILLLVLFLLPRGLVASRAVERV